MGQYGFRGVTMVLLGFLNSGYCVENLLWFFTKYLYLILSVTIASATQRMVTIQKRVTILLS